jgi:PAS domain S-box-containing protein
LRDATEFSGKTEGPRLGRWRRWDFRVHLVALALVCILPLLALSIFTTFQLARIERDNLWRALETTLALGALMLVFGVAAALIIARRVSRSMKALSDAALGLVTLAPVPVIDSPIREVREVASALKFAGARLAAHDRQLRRTQEHLARAQSVAAIGSFEHDIGMVVSRWSPETYVILGRTPKTLTPSDDSFSACVLDEDRPVLQHFIADLHHGREPAGIDVRIQRPNGALRTGHFEAQIARDEHGTVTGYIGTLQDVTDRHRLEEAQRELEAQLHHSQKLEALGTLAGGIAHDLNNTLVPVLALTKLVRNQLPAGSRERANLDTVLTAGGRARDLVAQVLAFSRKEKMNKRAVDLGEIVTESLKMLRASIPASIRLEARVSHGMPILCDPSQIHQVVINLLTNAAQAIGSRPGKIAVTLERSLGMAHGGPRVMLSVGDSGCGMDEQTRRRIFEPFFTTKPIGEGTGLGLSVVYGIVTTHGGTIEVKSEIGAGTRFEVTFPLATIAVDSGAALLEQA